MIKKLNLRYERKTNQSGFTLIEMLIVVIVLGILAMIIIPQITISTEDAKISTLQTNLAGIRSAIEVYYVQHSNIYPGEKDISGGTGPNDTEAAEAFLQQLTRYTNSSGAVTSVKDSTVYKYGPYIKTGSLPLNSFNELATVVANIGIDSITAARTVSGTGGWKVFPKTGVIFANDGESSGGVAHSTY